MAHDLVTIDGEVWRITNRQIVSYPCAESDEQRKARGDLPAPTISYVVGTIERVRDEQC